eukprot:TRINITY_DN11653_c0_g1_i2.p1 TRINITY_DN11653_c0_g1~~TRINITY_DN11653_c0_g1_i2.p1  ORF type:complete len:310 (+),score=89.83 TRINITY_DN11653_c0_g1_i2:2-931(+)
MIRRGLDRLELVNLLDALKKDAVDRCGDSSTEKEDGGKGEEGGSVVVRKRRRVKARGDGATLRLSNNRLNSFEHFEDDSFHQVTEVDLCGNFISFVDFNAFASFTRIRVLDIGANRLKTIPAAIRDLVELEELKLNNNLIERIASETPQTTSSSSTIDDGGSNQVLFRLTRLEILDLKSNRISVLENLTHNTALKRISLSCNKVSEIKDVSLPESMPQLEALGFFGNIGLTTDKGIERLIEAFSKRAPNLKELILSAANAKTPYRDALIAAFPSLQWLDFKYVTREERERAASSSSTSSASLVDSIVCF